MAMMKKCMTLIMAKSKLGQLASMKANHQNEKRRLVEVERSETLLLPYMDV